MLNDDEWALRHSFKQLRRIGDADRQAVTWKQPLYSRLCSFQLLARLEFANTGITASEQQFGINAANSRSLLFAFRASMEKRHVDLAIADWRRALDSRAAFDKQKATSVASILHNLRSPEMGDNYSRNELNQLKSAEHFFSTYAVKTYEQSGPKSAAVGHFKIGSEAHSSRRYREAAYHFSGCRSYTLAVHDASVPDKCQQGVIGAFSSFDDSDADELDKEFVILCSEFNTLDPWVSHYANPFPESSQDRYMFEEQIGDAKSLVHREFVRCAKRPSPLVAKSSR